MRQRDANLTALAAIGPRKKRKVDSPGPGSGTEVRVAWARAGGRKGLSQLTFRSQHRRAGVLLYLYPTLSSDSPPHEPLTKFSPHVNMVTFILTLESMPVTGCRKRDL